MIPVNRVMKMDGYRFRNAGFTFIELMVTMVILGVIATSAMIPMVFMIRQLEYTEHDFAQKEGMNRAGSFLSREISNFGPAPGRIAF
ncbi:MAG TPA: type II secretion system protein, partial [Synergistales bacterium]|nr:type II secretion system protein [Synergistales bacterium]